MRFLSFVAAVAAFALPFAAAATADGAMAAPVLKPPQCGLLCILGNAKQSSCAPTNNTCICTNAPLNAQIELCVKESCSIKDALLTKRFSTDTCQELGLMAEGEDRTAVVWMVGVVFGAVGMAAFFLRLLARLHVGAQAWGLDDWFMCLAVVLMIPLQIISIPLSEHGLGLDMWRVKFESINAILYYYYWDEMLYITCLAVTKISILCFYLKVFPKRSFRYAAYVMIALNCAYFISYDFILAFQCQPIDGAWLGWDGEYEAQCISINVLGWSAAAFNIALDMGTIILPLPQLFQLSMSWKKKIQIILMFAVGFFVTIVSIIRLQSLIRFGTTQNVTQDYVEVGYWSTIEAPVGIICACMPAIRSLFSLVFPQMFGTTQRDKSTYAMSSMGAKSKLSQLRPKERGDTSHTTTTTTQINVKQEWTVATSHLDGDHSNSSDEQLVRFDEHVTSAAHDGPRKVTLARSPSSPASPWQDGDLEAGQRPPKPRAHLTGVSRFDD